MIAALLWDVDGTLAETERDGHRVAFNQAFAALSIPWRWSEERYGELLHVAGGRERLLHDMAFQEHAPLGVTEREDLAGRLHRYKNECYAKIVAQGELPLRSGVIELLRDCTNAGIRKAIVTTTSRANVNALLQTHLGRDWPSQFSAIVCAEEAPRKKPDPQAYLLALDLLNLHPEQVVAMEDAPAGIAATHAARVPVVVTRSYYFPSPAAPTALACGPSLGARDGWHPALEPPLTRVSLDQINHWHARHYPKA